MMFEDGQIVFMYGYNTIILENVRASAKAMNIEVTDEALASVLSRLKDHKLSDAELDQVVGGSREPPPYLPHYPVGRQ